jgi:hypothetical protein
MTNREEDRPYVAVIWLSSSHMRKLRTELRTYKWLATMQENLKTNRWAPLQLRLHCSGVE